MTRDRLQSHNRGVSGRQRAWQGRLEFMMPAVIARKLDRLKRGQKARVLDLFSGCGGLSLGFFSAGFELIGAIESDPEAARSYGLNFHNGDARHSDARDITHTHPSALASALRLGPVEDAADVIIGGPPCQAFARVGRPKLREIENHPEAFRHDPRAQLYHHYLAYVKAFQPLAILMENVPDVLNHGGQNIADEVSEFLTTLGYVSRYTILNAAHYGVPQTRERMFLVATKQEIAGSVTFPAATFAHEAPRGYASSRAVALKNLRRDDLLSGQGGTYVDMPPPGRDLPPAVTASEAIGDLPALFSRKLLASGALKRGARRFDVPMPYPPAQKLPPYAMIVRSWPGFGAPAQLTDHVIRYLPRDYEIFARMKPGDQYPEAHAIASAMFVERLAAEEKIPDKRSNLYKELLAATVPPYDAGKFPNKWRKLCADQPARTLMAHLGKDSYSHIHYDSEQARTISVREAARLQSFPDGFVFSGTMNPAFRQIGNAVPPLVAKSIATEILSALKASVRNRHIVSIRESGRSREAKRRQTIVRPSRAARGKATASAR